MALAYFLKPSEKGNHKFLLLRRVHFTGRMESQIYETQFLGYTLLQTQPEPNQSYYQGKIETVLPTQEWLHYK